MRAKLIPQEQSIKKLFFVGLICVVIGTAALAVFWVNLPPEIPLYYSKPWGQSQLTSPIGLVLPLGLATTLLFLNSILAQLATNYPFLRKVLLLGSAVGCILALITTLRIVILVI